MDTLEFTRESIAKHLVEKHEKALEVTQEEFEKYSSLEQDLDKAAEKYKQERDNLNENVQMLKDERQNYYNESKDLRKEFIGNIKKKKSMSNIPLEVMILTKQIDQFEWEIQTEAVNVDDEKKLVKQIQDNLDKLHNYANMYKEHEEVSKNIRNLTSKLRRKLRKAADLHQKMLNAVNGSDKHHKDFVDAVVKLRDARAKRIGFQHEVEKHTKAIEHWQKVVDMESKKNTKPKSTEIKTQPKSKEKKDINKDKELDKPELSETRMNKTDNRAKSKETTESDSASDKSDTAGGATNND
jgi:uncharacterized coiled-coil DUF342 family protein